MHGSCGICFALMMIQMSRNAYMNIIYGNEVYKLAPRAFIWTKPTLHNVNLLQHSVRKNV